MVDVILYDNVFIFIFIMFPTVVTAVVCLLI